MIRLGASEALVVAKLADAGSEASATLGVRRSAKALECRLNGDALSKRSLLAMALPVQWISSQPQLLLSLGPDVRRRFLDMGMFHVEHQKYLASASLYQKALRQRNAALRTGNCGMVAAWDEPLTTAAEAIADSRQAFLDIWLPRVNFVLETWNPGFTVEFVFRRGWKAGMSLLDSYREKLDSDLALGYTYAGPHRADLEIRALNGLAEKTLSRGQQKLVVIAMNLGLIDVITDSVGYAPVLLFDDLSAELDQRNQQRVIDAINARKSQTFITRIENPSGFNNLEGAAMFHVEHGHLKA